MKCTICGKTIETLPLDCAYSINLNTDTNQWECYMKDCGYLSISEFVCENCCINKTIMNINEKFEELSLNNEEFKDELSYFKENIVQFKLNYNNFNYWVKFGNGTYTCGKGEIENPSLVVRCPQKTMHQILKGKIEPANQFLIGDLKIEGDIQYAVVYFDLLKLGLDINIDLGGKLFE